MEFDYTTLVNKLLLDSFGFIKLKLNKNIYINIKQSNSSMQTTPLTWTTKMK